MRSSDLDRQISVERRTITKDAVYGGKVETWVPLVPVGSPPVAARFWAQVQDVLPSRSESVRQGLEVARDQVRIRTRYRSDVTSDMRVTVHGDADVLYQIVGGPAMIGRKEWLEMVCERYRPAP